jgi:hypothetical protein
MMDTVVFSAASTSQLEMSQGGVGRGVVKPEFKEDAVFDAPQCAGAHRVYESDARAAALGIVKSGVALNAGDAGHGALGHLVGQFVKKFQPGRDVCGFVVVFADFELKAVRRGNAQVDVFREPLNQPVPLGQRCATFEFKHPALLL